MEAQLMDNADEAEDLLDKACDQCQSTLVTKMNEVKASVKQKRTNCTTVEEKQKYTVFVKAVTDGIRSTQGLFDSMFQRLRDLVGTVVGWIRDGVRWLGNKVAGIFTRIRSLVGL